ncbi:hypothetical protein BGZ61DRAFT_550756 [Ilyonectria robusta]|uniref:uncharacterized protein n=1 Tax=Ilyonectria robusta TaxID=1079257 RepID=UPI001E8EB261|nr:uncharacterized protein BGZ61DRAFT_550756 [Ilyonectria robusta]KAH8646456.1 hypothetical protein BGZ61DRAFT_550756 [Ilyonectria robusta]
MQTPVIIESRRRTAAGVGQSRAAAAEAFSESVLAPRAVELAVLPAVGCGVCGKAVSVEREGWLRGVWSPYNFWNVCHLGSLMDWEDDLAQARICLNILSFCSTTDSVALKFQDCLVPIHDKLSSYIQPTTSTSTFPNPSSFAYILRVPKTAGAERVSLPLKLLIMLCQPFGNINDKGGSNDDLGERQGWRLESSSPFRWDPRDLGIGETGFMESENRFLGSDEPSGWAAVGSEDESDELEWVMS